MHTCRVRLQASRSQAGGLRGSTKNYVPPAHSERCAHSGKCSNHAPVSLEATRAMESLRLWAASAWGPPASPHPSSGLPTLCAPAPTGVCTVWGTPGPMSRSLSLADSPPLPPSLAATVLAPSLLGLIMVLLVLLVRALDEGQLKLAVVETTEAAEPELRIGNTPVLPQLRTAGTTVMSGRRRLAHVSDCRRPPVRSANKQGRVALPSADPVPGQWPLAKALYIVETVLW